MYRSILTGCTGFRCLRNFISLQS